MKKLFALALLFVGLNFCLQSQARAQSPLIAFTKSEGQQLNIWTMRADGSGRKRLTSDGQSSEPAWSPDGRKIAYVITRPQTGGGVNSQIWMMNSDGGDKRAITRDSRWSASSPTFSADGKQLIFRIETDLPGDEPGSLVGVRRLDLQSLKSRVLTSAETSEGMFYNLMLSPSGGELYYTNDGGDYATSSLHRFDLKTRRSRKIYGYEFVRNDFSKKVPPYYYMGDFALSTDGKRIAFGSYGWVNTKVDGMATDTSKAGIVVMNSNGTGAKLIFKDKAETNGLCWSSDERKIIFSNQYALQMLDVKTGKKTVLLRGSGIYSPTFQPVAKKR